MKRVLIYSRSAAFRALMCGLTSVPRVEQHTATSQIELIERCRDECFDNIVTDDVRLFRSGSRAICALRDCARPCIIVLSPDLGEESAIAVLEEGRTQYISLPIEPQRLQRKLTL